jgi:hypothetical protein
LMALGETEAEAVAKEAGRTGDENSHAREDLTQEMTGRQVKKKRITTEDTEKRRAQRRKELRGAGLVARMAYGHPADRD